jgi:hypothetical protein
MADMADATKDPRAVSFAVAGVSGTVRPLRTGRDAINRAIYHDKLERGLQRRGGDDAEYVGRRVTNTFSGLCASASGVTGFILPSLADSEERVAELFIAWIDMDYPVYDACGEAFIAANAPTNDPDLLPPSMLPEEKKAKSLKSEAVTASTGTQG